MRKTAQTMSPEQQFSQETAPYVVISGNGRSGSNRLLDIFDLSPSTICRSEVNEVPEGRFNHIGGELFDEAFDKHCRDALREALVDARVRRSLRDRLRLEGKDFVTRAGAKLLAPMAKTPIRRALSRTGLIKSHNEWTMPAYFLNSDYLTRAVLVLKLNACPVWARESLSTDSNARVIHNIRNPARYLQSWYNRFIGEGVGVRSFEENFADVPKILAYFGRDDSDRLREPALENVVEVELWRWRHINEQMLALSDVSDRYLMVTYEEIDAKPVEAARKVFDFAGLPFGVDIEAKVASMENVLFRKPHSAALDAALCERLIARVLDGSPLQTRPPDTARRP